MHSGLMSSQTDNFTPKNDLQDQKGNFKAVNRLFHIAMKRKNVGMQLMFNQ